MRFVGIWGLVLGYAMIFAGYCKLSGGNTSFIDALTNPDVKCTPTAPTAGQTQQQLNSVSALTQTNAIMQTNPIPQPNHIPIPNLPMPPIPIIRIPRPQPPRPPAVKKPQGIQGVLDDIKNGWKRDFGWLPRFPLL